MTVRLIPYPSVTPFRKTLAPVLRPKWMQIRPLRPFTVSRSVARYQYQPLNDFRTIRLLKVERDASSIKTSLVQVSIDAPPPYVAISYVWGDSTIEAVLDLDGERLGVTKSLQLALVDALGSVKYCRSQRFGFSERVNEDAVYFWADAACINQSDIQEKNVQVPLMTEIYTNAEFVITHMGEGDDKFMLGFNMVTELLEWHNARRRQGLDSALPYGYELSDLGLPPLDSPRWDAVRSLFVGKWTERAWIMQEFIVNKNVILVSGHMTIVEWQVFSQMYGLTSRRKLPPECIHSQEQVAYDFARKISPNRVIMLSSLRTWYYKDGNVNKTMNQLLRSGHIMYATDPRDKVFALLNLAQDRQELGMSPDYSAENTTIAVYRSIAVKIITQSQSLDILSSVMSEKRIAGLPSWVPDWSHRPENLGNDLLRQTGLIRGGIYKACGDGPAQFVFDGNQDMLTVKGSIIDHVTVVFTDAKRFLGSTDVPISKVLELIERAYAIQGMQTYPTGESIKDAVWRTLIANTTHREEQAGQDYSEYFDAYCTAILSEAHLRSDKTMQMLLAYQQAMFSWLSGRSIVLTRAGFLGLAHNGVLPGDAIAVLRGGILPIVLRSTADDKYRVHSDAYVHGMMQGEVLHTYRLDDDICII